MSSSRNHKLPAKFNDCITGLDMENAIVGKKQHDTKAHTQSDGKTNNITFNTTNTEGWKTAILSYFGHDNVTLLKDGNVLKIKYNTKDIVNFNFYDTGRVTLQGASCTHFHDEYFEELKSMVEHENKKNDNSNSNKENHFDDQGTECKKVDESQQNETFEDFTSILDEQNNVHVSTPKIRCLSSSPGMLTETLNSMKSSIQTLEEYMCTQTKEIDTKIHEKMQKMEMDLSRNKKEAALEREKIYTKIEELEQKYTQRIQQKQNTGTVTQDELNRIAENVELKTTNNRLREELTKTKNENEKLKAELEKNQRENMNLLSSTGNELAKVKWENEQLKWELQKATSKNAITEVQQQTDDSYIESDDEEDENKTLLHSSVTISNRFSPLEKAVMKKPARQVEIIMDSHGNGLDPQKLYRFQDVNITVLGEGMKNTNGASKHLEGLEEPKHVVLGIGSNDLTNKDPKKVADEVHEIVKTNKLAKLHILPAFERIGKHKFNNDVRELNNLLHSICEKEENAFFITNDSILSKNRNLFARDGVHFNIEGKKSLARILKAHLNPHLGLKDYHKYHEPSADKDDYRPHWDNRFDRQNPFGNEQFKRQNPFGNEQFNRYSTSNFYDQRGHPNNFSKTYKQRQIEELFQQIVQII